MATATLQHVAVRGVVSAVPGVARSVHDLGAPWSRDETDKIAKTVGLSEVYRVRDAQTSGDLCIAAAERLLEVLGWERGSIDGIMMVTQTPDHFLPATACVAHGRLGLATHCLAFDVGLGCSGYVYGMWMAAQSVASGTCKRFIVLAGDTISRITSPADRSVALLFGDAGSATALEFDVSAPPTSFVLASDGGGAANLMVPAGAFRARPTPAAQERLADSSENVRAATDLYMNGLEIFNFTLERVPSLVRETIAAHGWTAAEVDAFLFHQANGFILGKIVKKLGVDAERVPNNIARFGNTSVASIPLLIADKLRERALGAEPLKVVLAGFGVGYSWAGAALTLRGMRAAELIFVD